MASTAAQAGSRTSVFISYARKPDGVLARELAVSLRALGFAVFLDVDCLNPGEPWGPRILDLVRECAAFILLMSATSVKSAECGKESAAAVQARKKLLPVRTEDLEDAQIYGNLPDAFQQSHRIEHVGSARSFADLVCKIDGELRRDADWYREQNYLSALERDWRDQPSEAKSLFLLGKGQTERARQRLQARGEKLPEPTTEVLQYIAASEDEHRRRARMRLLVTLVAPSLGLSTMVSVWLFSEAKNAKENSDARVEAATQAASNSFAAADAGSAAPAASAPSPPVATPTPAPSVSPPPQAVLAGLTQQFNLPTRRYASDELRRIYLDAPDGSDLRQRVVDVTIEALQPKSATTSYRVNLYVFVTLGRLPGWKSPHQRARVDDAIKMYPADETYKWWAAQALKAAAK